MNYKWLFHNSHLIISFNISLINLFIHQNYEYYVYVYFLYVNDDYFNYLIDLINIKLLNNH